MHDAQWQGYLRSDGRKGIRNLIVVIYTVECASFVAHAIGDREQDVHVIGFPGCYDNAYAIRQMLALIAHPNVGACLAVGLGCEYTQPAKLADAAIASGRPAEWFYIQDAGGTETGIAKGKAALNSLRAHIAGVEMVPMSWPDLTIGAECGGSDGTSGLAGNPVVGKCFDLLVERGGSAVFEEIVEMIGLREVMRARAATPHAAQQLEAAYDKAEAYCKAVRQYSVSPGNFAGGLTTIEEKSMGAFAKSGSRPIEGVVRVSEPLPHPGLWILDSVPDSHFMQFGYTNPGHHRPRQRYW
jgi:altronate hydrolase